MATAPVLTNPHELPPTLTSPLELAAVTLVVLMMIRILVWWCATTVSESVGVRRVTMEWTEEAIAECGDQTAVRDGE